MTGTQHKRAKRSIKHSVLLSLLIFAAIILASLWIFQILLLDDIYSSIVTDRLESTALTLESAIGVGDLDEKASYLSHEHNICIYIFKFKDNKALPVCSVHVEGGCLLHNISSNELSKLQIEASKSEDGVYIKRFPLGGFNIAGQSGNEHLSAAKRPDSIIYTKNVSFRDGGDGVIFLNCEISPVTATVKTLRTMLIWISLMTVVIAVIFAYILTYRVSAPIADVNRESKSLAQNKYDRTKIRRSYREIEELSDTLTYAASELSKVDSMQKELLANVSHDLRTPLTLIEGYSEMMRDIPGENTPENMQVVIDETKRLSTLVTDLLELSRMRQGNAAVSFETISLTDALEKTAERVKKLYAPDGYRIELSADGDVYVSADKTRLLQVIYNLIGNAVSYTGEDKTVYVTSRRMQSTSGEYVRVSVTDTGAGIAKEDLPLIWDRYYKLDKVHRRGAGGSGLGLSIVKENLLLHNARFGVASEIGEGSTFWFELPTVSQT